MPIAHRADQTLKVDGGLAGIHCLPSAQMAPSHYLPTTGKSMGFVMERFGAVNQPLSFFLRASPWYGKI
jgi:hypothetical protein